MKSKIYLLVFLVSLAFLSCSKETEEKMYPSTYESFKSHLNSNMTYTQITAKFGEPSNDIGSGIHIYVYQLTDSTEIWIGYADSILYCKHMTKEGELIENLI